MKKLFTLFAMLACVAVASAQHRLVATLSHNDTVSVYYGKSAFADAYNAAGDGDVITLSSGVFSATDINKNITIRGAGMEQDTVNNIAPTILVGSFKIYGGNSIVEGLCCSDKIHFAPGVSYKFSKCTLTSMDYHYNSNGYFGSLDGAEFVQCKIGYFEIRGPKATIINSFVNELYERGMEELEFINSIVSTSGGWHTNNTIFTNSILLDDGVLTDYSGVYVVLSESNMAYNCITTDKTNIFSSLLVNTNNARVDVAFKDTGFYELIDSVKTKYLGTDGTEVGIYGGPAPFNPTKTSYPRIEKFSVSQMNENGEVKVDVKVSTVEE